MRKRLFSLILSLLAAFLPIASFAADYTFISTQPAGDVTYYDRLSYGWYVYAGGNNIQYGPVPGAAKMVWAANDVVYIQDPLTANKMGTYIKAKKQGDKIVAEFPQVLGEIEDNAGKRPLYIGLMASFDDGKGVTYMPVEQREKDIVSWTIHEDGKITMDGKKVPLTESGKFADMSNLPDSVLGTYYYGVDDLTGEYGAIWNAVGDWEQTYTPVQTQEIMTIPEGLIVETWRMMSSKETRMVELAFDGDIVYMGGLTQYAPGAIKGYVQDGKVYFPTTQYMGFNEEVNTNVWFISAKAEYIEQFGKKYLSKFIRTDALEFNYDANKKVMTSELNTCFLINASATETNHYEYIVDPSLKYLTPQGMNANPKNPEVVVPGEDKGQDGLLFSVNIPVDNVDGVSLNTNRMFYNIYLNGELWTFGKDTYPYFKEDYSDVPYNYTDKYDLLIYGMRHDIYFHEEGIKSIGIQSCFLGTNNVLYKSDIITVGDVPETGDSQVEDYETGDFSGDLSTRTTFTYAASNVEVEPSGTGKKETYDVAIALTNPALVGKAITKIEAPVLPTTKVSGLSVWISKELKTKLVDGKNMNIVNKRWEVAMPESGKQQFVTVELEQPYVIPEGGLYVGYSLTVDEVDRSEAAQVPIVTAKTVKDGGFFLRTSRSFLSWQDRSKEFGVVAMTKVELAGDLFVNAATLGEMPFSYLAVNNEEQTVSIPVHNIGKEPISSLQYKTVLRKSEAEASEMTLQSSVTLDTPIPAVYAYSEPVAFKTPALDEQGDYDVTVEIMGVNDVANDAIDLTVANGKATVVKFVPKKLALMEEYTGTWCGWCPAGYVAMEKMNELYPDFVGIAYHDRDPMTMKNGYPNMCSGFPEAAFSRELMTHPYEAAPGMAGVFTAPQVWDYYCEGFVPVGISVNATLNADGIVEAHSTVEWVTSVDDEDYRVEYVLVADSLFGDTQGWAQHNYFSTEAKMMEYMEQFWHKDTYVRGLLFNDVAIMTSGLQGVSGSVTTTEPGVANEYTYTFDTSKALNLDNQLIPFHKDKLRVVAFLLKGDGYGKVVNATKCDVVVDPAGIHDTQTAKAQAYTRQYNLSGQRVSDGYKGIVVKNGKKMAR